MVMMRSKALISLVAALAILLAVSAIVAAQPQLKVEFYFPHYFNPTFKAQTNEQVIVSGGYKGRGSQYGAVYVTNTGSETLKNLQLEVCVPKQDGFEVLRPPRGGKVSDDKACFTVTIKELDPGQTYRASFKVKVPTTTVQKIVEFKVTVKDSQGNVLFQQTYRRPFVPTPFYIYAALLVVTVVVLGIMFYLISKGKLYGKSFKTKDIIYTTIFAILLVAWVQIIGRMLGFFALTNRIPLPFVNYALGDIGFATLFVLGVLLVRKPGVATLMLLIYDIVSELLFYGLDPRWWLYPLAEGIPVDLYLAFANKVFASKFGTETGTIMLKGIWGYIDAAIIGGLRALFAWLSLYYVFYPFLSHFYTTTYVVFMHTATITIFNMIYGALIAYPLYRVLVDIIP